MIILDRKLILLSVSRRTTDHSLVAIICRMVDPCDVVTAIAVIANHAVAGVDIVRRQPELVRDRTDIPPALPEYEKTTW